jgi:uncharacterized cupin superfamily protein
MKEPVAHLHDLALNPAGNGDNFEAKVARVGPLIGMKKLGALYICVEPGKRAFPFHAHHANEEAFVILEGEGTYRLGEARHPISAGDVVAAPAGGPETAHQIINTGSATLKYLALSTMLDPEVVEYPDSNKFAALSVFGADEWPPTAGLRFIGRLDSAVGYFDGETGDE